MKKRVFLSVALATLALASCGKTNEEATTAPSEPGTVVPTPVPTPEPTPTPDPLKLTITGAKDLWIDETLELKATFNKETTDEIVWSTSDAEVLKVENGLLTPIKAGKVKITASSKTDATVKAEVEINVLDSIVNLKQAAEDFDVTGLKGENPSMTTKPNGENPVRGFADAKLNAEGTKYYAEATFSMTDANYGNEWNRVSIGHQSLDGSVYRALGLSFGCDKGGNNRKTIVMEQNLNGDVAWGPLTDRTQVWGMGGRRDWDFTNLKAATLRNGNDYYYYVNDKLVWKEVITDKFINENTIPTIVTVDIACKVSNINATTDEAKINEKLGLKETQNKFFATYADKVIINEEQTEVEFKNDGKWPCTNNKDFAAMAIGDATKMYSGDGFSVKFDLTVNNFRSDTFSCVGVTLRNVGGNAKEALSVFIGEDKLFGNGWNYDGDINLSSSYVKDLTAALQTKKAYKVEIRFDAVEVDGNFRRQAHVLIDGVDTGFDWGNWYGFADVSINLQSYSCGAKLSNLEIVKHTK